MLAPLTLLVGENSTGKTSFMVAVRVLWDVLHGRREPNFKEEPYDLGSFDDIAHFRGAGAGEPSPSAWASTWCTKTRRGGPCSTVSWTLSSEGGAGRPSCWNGASPIRTRTHGWYVTKRAKVVEPWCLRVGTAESAWEIDFGAELGFLDGYLLPPLVVPDMAEWEAIGFEGGWHYYGSQDSRS